MKNGRNQAGHVTRVGMGVNLCLVLAKGVAGILARSAALTADAVHSLSDFGSDIVVLAGLRMADRPPDRTHRYGHGKFETFAAFILAVFLVITAVGIAVSGIARIIRILSGEVLQRPGVAALFVIILSIGVKEWMYRYTILWGRRLRRPALEANAIHHRSDALSSIAALIGVAGARFLGPSWRILDPVAGVVVAVFVLMAAGSILIRSVRELLEAAVEPEVEAEIRRIAGSVPGAMNPHSLRNRRIGSSLAVELHIEVDPDLTVREANRIGTEVEQRLLDHFGNGSILTIHLDPLEAKE